jgi:hypothetical protein
MFSSRTAILTTIFTLASATQAIAGLSVEEWYFGKWECLNNGRAADMEWRSREVQNSVCNGEVCSSSSSSEIVGSYREGNGPVLSLTRVNSSPSLLLMNGPDGNLWSLTNKGKRAEGWATLNGQRNPLSCARKGSGRVRRGPIHP